MIHLASDIKTPLHRWPAGFKLAGLCALSTGLFLISSPIVSIGIFVAILLIYLAIGREFFILGLKSLISLWMIIAVLAIWHGLTQAYGAGIVIALRLLSAVALANLVTMTTSLRDMIDVILILFRPVRYFGINSQAISMTLALVIRFIPVLLTRANVLTLAYRARSHRRASWRIILPLVFTVLDDADHVSDALRARGGFIEKGKS